jgi:hypothetical protein
MEKIKSRGFVFADRAMELLVGLKKYVMFCMLMYVLLSPHRTMAGWVTETVDNQANAGWDNSLALDAAGNPHISYYDYANFDLKYAYHNGTSWQLETVDSAGDVGWSNSLALDASGNPHISYLDDTNDSLKYAYHNGSTWMIETVDGPGPYGGGAGWATSIALDASGNPHISYAVMEYAEVGTRTAVVRYAARVDGNWVKQAVKSFEHDPNYGFDIDVLATSLALEADGTPHISFDIVIKSFNYRDIQVYYSRYDENAQQWVAEIVDSQVAVSTSPSLVLNGSDSHLSYVSYTGGMEGCPPFIGEDPPPCTFLIHAFLNTSDVWVYSTVDSSSDVMSTTSLALDGSGNPHISYTLSETNSDVKYAFFNGSAWQDETVLADIPGDQELYPSLALDGSGTPHISYWMGWGYGLGYAVIDTDNDGITDDIDNCPDDYNPGQGDVDNDGIGDACDACTDVDGDGYGDPGDASCTNGSVTDCDDGVEFVYPGATEVCNDTDDDCDGSTDEGYPTLGNTCDGTDSDLCENGTYTCTTDGTGVECVNETVTDIAEICDSIDNDCDTLVDNDDPDLTVACAATTYRIDFDMTDCGPGGCTKTYDDWLPEDGNTARFKVTVRDDADNPVVATITLTEITISTEPGKYTNDSDTSTGDDFLVEKSGTALISGNTISSGDALDFSSYDYGGSVIIRAEATVGAETVRKYFRLPKDTDGPDADSDGVPDGDGLPDAWEELYTGNISPGDDLETHTGSSILGDELSASEEYRGIMWGAKLVKVDTTQSSFTCVDTDSSSASCSNPYQTDAYLPEASPSGHYRTDPNRKDLFIKFEFYDYVSYDSTTATHTFTREYAQTGCAGVTALATATIFDNCTFALGSVFNEEVGLDVYVYRLTAADVGDDGDEAVVGENNIDAAVVKNAFSEAADARDNHIFPRPANYNPRDWSWSTKGRTNSAGDPAVIYSDVKTFQYALDNYFNEYPYIDDEQQWGGSSWVSDPGGNDKLDMRTKVEDTNDDGVLRLSGGPPSGRDDATYNDGDSVLDGDHLFEAKNNNQYICKPAPNNPPDPPNPPVCTYELTVFDIDKDGMIEHALQGDPDSIPASAENTKAQALKHTLSHEVGHAIGIGYGMERDGHTNNPTCLMDEPSINWRRDDHFSTEAEGERNVKSEIYIHNN